MIGEKVRKQGNKDIRDVISLGTAAKLIRKGDEAEEIEGLVKTLAKYGCRSPIASPLISFYKQYSRAV
jgi:hypothetical protein